MTIELTILISVISVSVAVLSFAFTQRRNAKQEDTEDATQLTTIIVKLGHMQDDMKELKNRMESINEDIRSLQKDIQHLDHRITVVEERYVRDKDEA